MFVLSLQSRVEKAALQQQMTGTKTSGLYRLNITFNLKSNASTGVEFGDMAALR